MRPFNSLNVVGLVLIHASIKLQKAQNYLRKLLADQGGDKRLNYNMAGSYKYGNDPSYSRHNRLVPYLDYIPS